ncbi:hypothetical protein BS50DRAFT_630325 [Corynespora cassiicola Philippines]|uniref:C2H2-type domain-containing protein n=1 Tax=Corynespora cassiicola Philippines TaxID=1448308 RepID=A0A2T2P3L8_CORCC|nr:hypothetical protein BS50DRAFT_630325 [Corynespora cassiicola Philippines]
MAGSSLSYSFRPIDIQQTYPYSNQPSYAAVPQYTQSQVDSYFAQYGCYPPQPYQILPDSYYAQPVPNPYQSQTAPVYQQDYGLSDHSSTAPEHSSRSSSRPRETKTWTCDLPNCTSTANFTRLADLQRHQSTVHGVGTPDFPCTVPKCTRVGDKGFTRRDHLVEHLRNFHHLDIPKRRPGERSANPLGLPHFG